MTGSNLAAHAAKIHASRKSHGLKNSKFLVVNGTNILQG